MQELFSLGELYISDFLKDGEEPRGDKVEMKLMMDDDGIVRLEKSADKELMWGKYWYRSSINSSMREQLRDVVESIKKVVKLQEKQLFIDIASNDGTLLSYVPQNLIRVGIDPAEDSFRLECERHSDLVIQDYFSADVFKKSKFGKTKAKVVTCVSMFYDLENPEIFLQDIYEILDDDGIFVLQLSYTPLMLFQMAFDNICHEHARYYSLFNLKILLEGQGFKIMDVQLNDTNAGSFRLFIMKKNARVESFSSQPYRDVCKFRMDSLLSFEKELKMDYVETWKKFYKEILLLKEKTVSFIKEEKSKGKVIYGYGASTKGNTLLQLFGLDNTLITAIAERSPYKYGLRTIGSNIPIISEDEMRKAKVDYLLILPFHFINEFIEREKDFLDGGGKMIVTCPQFKIISK